MGIARLAGSVVYLASGTITTVDEALFESAAGFSTVAATTLDPESLGTSMSLFRAGTQFVGGLVGLLAGVGGTASHNERQRADPEGRGSRADGSSLIPSSDVNEWCGCTWRSLPHVDSATSSPASGSARLIHALTTVSTGGFSDRADSLVSAPGGAKVVATVFMLIGGVSFFALFWLLRGNHRRFVKSPELRIYLGIIGVVTLSFSGRSMVFRRRRALHGGKCVEHDRTRCDRMDRLSVGCAGPVARCGRHRSDGRISRKWATRHSSLAPVPVRARDSAAARSQRGHARAPRRSHARRQGTRLTDRLSDRPLRPLRNRRVHARTHWR